MDDKPSLTDHRRGTTPRTWLLIGDKLGDNAQARAIADALGWPVESRSLRFLEPYQLGKPDFRPSLYHVDHDRSDPLTPPWPDLLITVGRRPAMAALWVKAQSGGRTRVVLLGRPKRRIEEFDLVVAPAQYRLPRRGNVLRIDLPLIRVDRRRLAEASSRPDPRLDELARPLIAVLVGGATAPFTLDADVARDLMHRSAELVRDGGTLVVTTSRRTPGDVTDALAAALPERGRIFPWSAGARDNPYLALLARADGFVVTGDSVSMLTEVADLGRPLAIYELPTRRDLGQRVRAVLGRALHGERAPLGWLGEALCRAGVMGYSRDLTEIHRRLYARGSATHLGEPMRSSSSPLDDELGRVVERVRGLVPAAFPQDGPPAQRAPRVAPRELGQGA